MSRYNTLLASAEKIAAAAADELIAMRQRRLTVTRKEGLDIVTEADLAAESIILKGLSELVPGAAIFSEEAGHSGPADGAQRGGKVDRGGGFADAAFLIRYGEYSWNSRNIDSSGFALRGRTKRVDLIGCHDEPFYVGEVALIMWNPAPVRQENPG